ncbi:MAG: DUF167 domain-containing protein [Desulfovibrio sp.]
MRPEYIRPRAEGEWLIHVWVQPGAKKNEVVGTYQENLKVRLSAPAVDNKANKALVVFMAKVLGAKKKQVTLVSGQTNRRKTLLVVADDELQWRSVFPDSGHP